MRQLYMETRRALRRGLNLPVDRAAYIEHHRTRGAGETRRNAASRANARLLLWDDPDPEFFMQHSVGADRVVDGGDRKARPRNRTARARARCRRPRQRRRRHRDIPVYARPTATVCRKRDRDRSTGSVDSRRAHPHVGRKSVLQQLHRARRIGTFDQRERGALPTHRAHADRSAERSRALPRTRETPHSPTSEAVPAADGGVSVERRRICSGRCCAWSRPTAPACSRASASSSSSSASTCTARRSPRSANASKTCSTSAVRGAAPIRDPDRIEIVTRTIRERLDQQLNEETLAS